MFIEELDRGKELIHIEKKVSIDFEISAIMRKHDGKQAILFENVEGYSTKIVSGICGTKERLCKPLNVPIEKLHERLLHSIQNPMEPKRRSDAEVKEVQEKPRLTKMPILRHYEKDAGRYLTSAIVSAKSMDGKIENVSIHRLMLLDDRRLAIRIVPRQLYRLCQIAKEEGEKTLDVGIALGLYPPVLLAASALAPFGVSEYWVANALMQGGFTITNCENVDASVPAEAELALEGRINLEVEVDEGPLVDITETYDIVRKQPIIEVVNVFHREDYVYQALLPGGKEHKLLMGLPYEARIMEAVKGVSPAVKAVNLTLGGCGWFHVAISIEKQTEGDGKNVLMAAFGAHPSLKHAVVVDSDIDVHKPEEVEWAIATRFQGNKGLILIPDARGSSLDPSSDQERMLTTKVGIDATRSLLKPRDKFMKARIPGEEEIAP